MSYCDGCGRKSWQCRCETLATHGDKRARRQLALRQEITQLAAENAEHDLLEPKGYTVKFADGSKLELRKPEGDEFRYEGHPRNPCAELELDGFEQLEPYVGCGIEQLVHLDRDPRTVPTLERLLGWGAWNGRAGQLHHRPVAHRDGFECFLVNMHEGRIVDARFVSGLAYTSVQSLGEPIEDPLILDAVDKELVGKVREGRRRLVFPDGDVFRVLVPGSQTCHTVKLDDGHMTFGEALGLYDSGGWKQDVVKALLAMPEEGNHRRHTTIAGDGTTTYFTMGHDVARQVRRVLERRRTVTQAGVTKIPVLTLDRAGQLYNGEPHERQAIKNLCQIYRQRPNRARYETMVVTLQQRYRYISHKEVLRQAAGIIEAEQHNQLAAAYGAGMTSYEKTKLGLQQRHARRLAEREALKKPQIEDKFGGLPLIDPDTGAPQFDSMGLLKKDRLVDDIIAAASEPFEGTVRERVAHECNWALKDTDVVFPTAYGWIVLDPFDRNETDAGFVPFKRMPRCHPDLATKDMGNEFRQHVDRSRCRVVVAPATARHVDPERPSGRDAQHYMEMGGEIEIDGSGSPKRLLP